MKTIRVQFDFGITNKMHTLYNSYFNYPPKGVKYIKSEFRIVNKKTFGIFRKIYYNIKKIIGEKHLIVEDKIKDTLRKDKGFDLIHFANHLGKTEVPFVADYESVTAFSGVDCKKEVVENSKTLLRQKNLKCLMPMNKEALKGFNSVFKEKEFQQIKQVLLHPITYIPENQKKKIKKENIVLFAGSGNILNQKGIYNKGSYEILIAFEKLSKLFPDWKFLYFGKTPNESKYSENENFKVLGTRPQEELWKAMRKSKIFVQTSYETPAMIFVEAMNFRLPIITYDSCSNGGYVDKKNGILIKPEGVNIHNEYHIALFSPKDLADIRKNAPKNSEKIIKAVTKLIKNPKICQRMGEESFRRASTGKFSLEKRNNKLLKIYKEALSN